MNEVKWVYDEEDDGSEDDFEKFQDKSKRRVSEDFEDARRLERKKLRKRRQPRDDDEDDS